MYYFNCSESPGAINLDRAILWELEGLNEQQMSGVAVAYSEAGYASWAELVIGPEKGGDGSIWA